MTIFSETLLAQLQTLSEGEMPDSFMIDVPGTFTSDGQGGGTTAPGTIRGPYACRFGAATVEEQQSVADRMDVSLVQRMTYSLDVPLALHETGSGTKGRSAETFAFEVVGLAPPSSHAVHRKALVRPL